MVRIGVAALAIVLMLSGAGIGKGANDIEALIREARRGDTRAMCELGMAYYHGHGVLKDPFKAKCWVKQAHDLGYQRAETLWNKFELWQYSGNCSLGFDHRPEPENYDGDRFMDPVTGMRFIRLSGRCFKMGCRENGGENCPKEESPAHRVCVDSFWMGEYEVTQKVWTSVMGDNPSRFKGDDLPVEQVSFREVGEFISRLNRKTGLRFALPTEAQWEFACRSRGKRSVYPWGHDGFRPAANCGGCDPGHYRGRTAPVGSFEPNEAGIYDMGGNVREWCRDLYEGQSDKKKGKDRNSNKARSVRGGSFLDPVSKSRCRARAHALPGMKTYFTGFRLMLREID